jgi:hypothetical protein
MCDADPLSAYILPRRERKIKALGGESCLAGRDFRESVPPTAKALLKTRLNAFHFAFFAKIMVVLIRTPDRRVSG